MSGGAVVYEGKDLEAMSFAPRYHRWILSRIAPYLGKEVAEVGAGSGNFTELVADPARHVTAIEPSAEMYPRLVERFTGNPTVTCRQGLFTDIAKESAETFDSILYINVLEHVEQDAAELTLVHEALKPGGHAIIFVPALPFLYSEFDREIGHYRRYTRRDLRRKIEAAGLIPVSIDYFDAPGILPWYVAFTLLRKKLSPGSAGAYDRLVVPIAQKFESLIRPPIGKNLLAIARRNA